VKRASPGPGVCPPLTLASGTSPPRRAGHASASRPTWSRPICVEPRKRRATEKAFTEQELALSQLAGIHRRPCHDIVWPVRPGLLSAARKLVQRGGAAGSREGRGDPTARASPATQAATFSGPRCFLLAGEAGPPPRRPRHAAFPCSPPDGRRAPSAPARSPNSSPGAEILDTSVLKAKSLFHLSQVLGQREMGPQFRWGATRLTGRGVGWGAPVDVVDRGEGLRQTFWGTPPDDKRRRLVQQHADACRVPHMFVGLRFYPARHLMKQGHRMRASRPFPSKAGKSVRGALQPIGA
jgi:hypothetical protein